MACSRWGRLDLATVLYSSAHYARGTSSPARIYTCRLRLLIGSPFQALFHSSPTLCLHLFLTVLYSIVRHTYLASRSYLDVHHRHLRPMAVFMHVITLYGALTLSGRATQGPSGVTGVSGYIHGRSPLLVESLVAFCFLALLSWFSSGRWLIWGCP